MGLADEIRAVYGQAAKEVEKKTKDFWTQHKAKAAKKLKDLEDGKITKEEYQRWLDGQVFIGERWKEKLDDITRTYVEADEKAREIINKTDKNVFVKFANQQGEDIKNHVSGYSFDLYDKHTVERLLQEDPKMLPEWKIDKPKDYTWNEKRIKNEITQGIIQGESIPEIAKRLSSGLATDNEKKMNMFARTAVTGAQNAGRINMLHQAQEKGIVVKKKWLATSDKRTRDVHRYELNGAVAEVDEPFHTSLGDIMFPGDPNADPANTYNCRCTLVYVYDVKASKENLREREEQEEAEESKREKQNDKEESSLDDLFGDLWNETPEETEKREREEQEKRKIQEEAEARKEKEEAQRHKFGQNGLLETEYPKELRFSRAEQEYVERLDEFWHDETKEDKNFKYDKDIDNAIRGAGIASDEKSFLEHLSNREDALNRKIDEANEMIEERKASGYKGATRKESYAKWKSLQRELVGADEFEAGEMLENARVGEKGIRYWQIQRKEAEEEIEKIDLARKAIKRRDYAKKRGN